MIRRTKGWFAATVVFSLVNLAGAVMAAAQGELSHAGVHVVLLLVGVYYLRHIWFPERAAVIPAMAAASGEITDRLTHLELSVEAVALEIERVGEGQRFITRFLSERETSPASGAGESLPHVPPRTPT